MTSTPHTPDTPVSENARPEIATPAIDPWWIEPSIVEQLTTAERQYRTTAYQWAQWAADLAALRDRMPPGPALSDPTNCDSTPLGHLTHIDPALVRRDLAGPVAAADHLAAIYTRHAARLAHELADAIQDSARPAADARSDRGAW